MPSNAAIPADETESFPRLDSGSRAAVIASAMGLLQLFPVHTKRILFMMSRLFDGSTLRSGRSFVKAPYVAFDKDERKSYLLDTWLERPDALRLKQLVKGRGVVSQDPQITGTVKDSPAL